MLLDRLEFRVETLVRVPLRLIIIGIYSKKLSNLTRALEVLLLELTLKGDTTNVLFEPRESNWVVLVVIKDFLLVCYTLDTGPQTGLSVLVTRH